MKHPHLSPVQARAVGVRIAGTGSHVPEKILTNAALQTMVDTTDEWIVQRTGIHERRICDPQKGENTTWLCTEALKKALSDARMQGSDLDLVIVASVTGDMTCPSTACRVAANVGAGEAPAFDILAACCGFVFALNIAHDMVRAGSYRSIGVIGCDMMTKAMDYSDRGVCILFGDAAGAVILRATDDTTKGCLAAEMHASGAGWKDLYLPQRPCDLPAGADGAKIKMHTLQMNGREVYKFAVGTFADLIQSTLDRVGLKADDIDQFVCHQSNARMLESARERFGIPPEKLFINIDRFGNCSAGSVPLAFDQLRKAGHCRESDIVMFVAFGGGLTWASSLWRL